MNTPDPGVPFPFDDARRVTHSSPVVHRARSPVALRVGYLLLEEFQPAGAVVRQQFGEPFLRFAGRRPVNASSGAAGVGRPFGATVKSVSRFR
ncbi:hypothetical protein [Pseudonocardia sp. ICBG1142]|uniref:hypothetical protein n=1 Tax=Pseudonocardia sp. ICBG1142 TaxID=2846760 RepID=UPI00155E4256|nr:hypothetical protein [Pseudonocardia sp. ICBG1142]